MTVSLDGRNAIKIEKKNGKNFVTIGYFNQASEFKPSWCRWGFEPKEGEKPQTYSINFGDDGLAPEVAKELLIEIAGNEAVINWAKEVLLANIGIKGVIGWTKGLDEVPF